jgi:radical SAM superfamily enzyme YgiQ (UPF0313 family)
MYLSAALKRAFGESVRVKLINTGIDCDSREAFLNDVREFVPDLVGIRALTVAREFFLDTITALRKATPRAKFAVGGPHASHYPAEVMAESPVDFAAVGEGETIIVELAEYMLGQRRIEDIHSIYFRQGDRIVATQPQPLVQDVDSLGVPDYSVVDQQKYESVLSYGYTMRRQGVILSSRGCPYRCAYCAKFMGNRFRPRSAESVVDEIRHLRDDLGIRDIMFVDDTFNLDRRRVEAIFREVIARGLHANYYFPAGLRAELMTRDLVDLLVEAGTCWITYAVESAVPRILTLVHRQGNAAKAAEIIDYTINKSIMVGLFFMVGFPTETFDEAMSTLQYVRQRRGVTLPFFFSVKYFSGTELTRMALELGAIGSEYHLAAAKPYHDISAARTSTITPEEFQNLFTYYMKDILLDEGRLRHALDVQESFLSKEEVAATYSALLGRNITDARRTFRHVLA